MTTAAQSQSRSELSVLTVSDMCVDLVVTGNVRPQFHQVEQIVDDYAIELGGSANVFASQLAKLGQRVGVIGYVGKDQFGDFAFQRLCEAGVDTTYLKQHSSLKTGLGLALTEPADRAMLTYMGTIDATQPADLKEEMLDSCRHWHFASIFLLRSLRAFWLEWLRKCREKRITVSMDPNWDPDNRWEGVTEVLPYVDVFLPNEAEARALTGEADMWKAAKLLSAKGPLVVVKCGEQGAIAVHGDKTWQINGSEFREPEFAIVDTTGAGDNFDAGFLRGWLLGYDIDFSLQLAHRCALSSLGYAGGIRGQLEQMIELKTIDQ